MKSQLEQGIEAYNQDFRKYDQVDKIQRYRLSESEEDQFDEDYQIKICDMSQFFSGGDAGKMNFAQELGESLEDVGFAIITEHGIDQELYRKARGKVVEFFEDTPLETKNTD